MLDEARARPDEIGGGLSNAASEHAPVVALAGGVGAARFLRGLTEVVDPEQVTAIVNTGDDREFYGVHVSPDVDIVLYTLAGLVHPEKGFGLAGDGFQLVDTLAQLGHETWFRLGDRDFAQCLHRSLRIRDGHSLCEVTDELRTAHQLALRILPMSQILRNHLHDNGPPSDRGGQKAKALYSDEGSTNWNISGNVVENNGGPNFVWMSGCRDTAINNSWSSNFYSCKSVSGKVLGPHGRTSECCDSECS